MGTLAFGQPVRHPQDVARRRAKGPCLRQRVPRRVDRPSADHEHALMHINPRAALKHDIHLGLSSLWVAVAARSTTPEEMGLTPHVSASHARALGPVQYTGSS